MTPGYLGHFDPRLAPQSCEVITTTQITWRGGRAIMRAIRPASMPIADADAFAADIRDAALRIGLAMDRMDGGMTLSSDPAHVGEVTILFTNYVSPRVEGDEGFDKGAYVAGANDVFANECPVSYYKRATASDANYVEFTLAHEIFHCIQYRTWPRARDVGWLIEGTAEYFAYLAKPEFGAGFIPRFDARIPRTGLEQLDYPAVVFYLWMGQTRGPRAVRDFIPSVGFDMETDLPADTWLEFGQAYFDGTIRMPDNRPLPSTPQTGVARTISGNQRIASPAYPPYTLNQEVWSFAADKRYQLTYTPRPPDTRITWRKAEGGGWVAPLTSVSTCRNRQDYRVLYVSTNSFGFGDTTVRVEPGGGGSCTCPVGIWTETSDSLRRYFEQSLFPGGQGPEFVGGGRRLVLNADHTGSFTYDSIETITRSSDPMFWLRQIKTGGTHFTWKVVNGVLLTVYTPGDNLLTLANEQHTRTGVISETRRGPPQSIGHEFFCDDAGLHLRQIARPPALATMMRSTFDTSMDFAPAGN
ncbi:MAG: hypothetical protein V4459_08935 [Pseudomonadota bacterium]